MTGRVIILSKVKTVIVSYTLSRTNSLHIITRHISIIYQASGVGIRTLHRAVNAIQSELNIRQYLNAGFSIYRSGRFQIQPTVAARSSGEQHGTDK